ncbi:glycosyltransferase [Pseudodesulfovibrio portus]|uniref:Glycosyl transferase n=1 Tax=Pseudodesulfovibrio portus TaxID=231439 RepID=A0ABN6RTA4_9BACT|nr:glycosyltransferase [Pseudodesulfovibrio portus]BDQ33242.1 glycosyl transferase [Pseudodesulfovibrio portus]
MRVLITHTNFPAQFRHIAEYLGHSEQNQIVFATRTLRKEWAIPGVTKVVFAPDTKTESLPHPLARGYDDNLRHGTAMVQACETLKKRGFVPDVILGHSGWGQTMFLRDVFPDVPFVGYFEWYYDADSAEFAFEGKELDAMERARLRTRNTPMLHDLASCRVGVTPTAWQRAQFPAVFQPKLVQAHDGINTRYFAPAEGGRLPIGQLDLPDTDLTGAEELVTYCARGLEPYRGFPSFYESLPAILEARPGCHVLIVGEDRVCYSPKLPGDKSYRETMCETVPVDESRVHFTGPLPYGLYKQVLQASSAHVYLTWPFVLSWSLLEAMSCSCLVVGSDTEPVREVIRHGENGLLTDFHSPEKIAETTIDALARQEEYSGLRDNARQTVLDAYCLSKCLPAHLNLLARVAGVKLPANQQQKQG